MFPRLAERKGVTEQMAKIEMRRRLTLIALHFDEVARRGALRRAGYSYGHTAQQFDPGWFDRIDLVLGMDYDNVRDLRGMAPDSLQAGKVRIFRSFDPALMHLPEDDPALETPDPYYGTDADFDAVVAMVEPAADGIIDHVRLELSDSQWGIASD